MRIGIVELYCGESGKKGYYNNQEIGIARAMARLGYEVCIFYPQKLSSNVVEETIEERIQIIYVPAVALGNHGMFSWKILLDYSLDIVQLGADNQMLAGSLLRFCDKEKIPVYNYIGTVCSDTDRKWKYILMDIFLRKNLVEYRKHVCFAKTQTVYEKLKSYGVFCHGVVPVGLDTSIIPSISLSKSDIRRQLDLPTNKKIILFVGRMEEYKRPWLAVELLKRLSDEYMLIMIGTGSLDAEIQDGIEREGLTDRTVLIKQIENKNIHQFYRASDFLVNLNEKEIFGMSILEAIYQDCYVVAMNAPGPNEIIKNNACGSITGSLEEMLDVLKMNKTISCGDGRKYITENYSWDNSVKIILDNICCLENSAKQNDNL